MRTELATAEEVARLSDATLLKEFERRLSVVTEGLVQLAEIVGEMFRREIPIPTSVNPMLIDVLRKIDSKQILPELAERFMHHPVFNRIKSLPMDDQKRIAETGKVEIAVRRGDKFDTRLMEVASLQKDQARLAFDGQRIRSVTEQTAILESQPPVQDDPFDDAEISVSVPLTRRERNVLAKKAAAAEKALGQYIRDVLKSKKVI